MHALKLADTMLFLSTLSLRRATTRGQLPTPEPPNFYPRSPCGERQPSRTRKLTNIIISIHALLAESDFTSVVNSAGTTDFYPRSPCGERLGGGE